MEKGCALKSTIAFHPRNFLAGVAYSMTPASKSQNHLSIVSVSVVNNLYDAQLVPNKEPTKLQTSADVDFIITWSSVR